MSIFCLSFNHQRVPIEIRERLSWDTDRNEGLLQSLLDQTGVSGAMLLSTCNRLELYSSGVPELTDKLEEWIAGSLHEVFNLISGLGQKFSEDECVRHLIRVACGLDSQSLGETQILGQIKTAYQHAAKANTLDFELHQLCQHVFYSAKRIRHDLQLNRYPVSIAGTAVQLMRRLFPDIKDKNILIIGAGSTSRIVAQNLHRLNFSQMCIVNRTRSSAANLAKEFNAVYCDLDQLANRLAWADIVFSCVDNRPGLVGKGMVESAVSARKHVPQLVFDLGVPRNFEAEVGSLDDIFLYNLDQIHAMAQDHVGLRRGKISAADRLVDHHVDEYNKTTSLKSFDPLIRRFRQSVTEQTDTLVEETMQRATDGDLRQSIQWLVKKIQARSMHVPTLLLKQLAIKDEALLREVMESLSSTTRDRFEEQDESTDA